MNSYMTKYEISHILGIRMNQLSENAPILTTVDSRAGLLQIAATELKDGKLNINIKRPLAHNKYYIVNSSKLKIPNDLIVLLEMLITQHDT